MEKEMLAEGVKTRLIIAGIEEISTHGVADFSLRRVAARCEVSCAAPYRHFKNRDEFIREILAYIHSKWQLFSDRISRLYAGDTPRLLTELCVAYIRFLEANANYRAALSASGKSFGSESTFLSLPLADYCRETGKDEDRLSYSLHAVMYGTVTMLDCGELENTEDTFRMIRETICGLLS